MDLTGCSSRRPGFESQHPQVVSKLSFVPVPGNLGTFLASMGTYLHAGKRPKHIKLKKSFLSNLGHGKTIHVPKQKDRHELAHAGLQHKSRDTDKEEVTVTET